MFTYRSLSLLREHLEANFLLFRDIIMLLEELTSKFLAHFIKHLVVYPSTETIPSPLVIKPLNSSVEEFAAYDIDADTDFAPEMFFFEDLNKNGYHCDWRKSCLEFRLTFEPTMKGTEPSIIGILVLLEGQDFIHTTVISVAGQTISAYVLLSNRQGKCCFPFTILGFYTQDKVFVMP